METTCPKCQNTYEINAEPVCENCYHPSSDHDDGWRSCLCGECEEFEDQDALTNA